MTRVAGSPFKIDWKSKQAVIAYARKLGEGMFVYKHPDRDNYNITHNTLRKEINPSWVVFET